MRIPLLMLLLVLLAACSRPPDETQIRQALQTMAKAVEQHNPGPVLERLAPDFQGPDGMGKRQTRALLVAQYFRNPKIHLFLTGVRIHVDGDEADVEFHAAIAGGAGLLPQRAQYYAVTTHWRKTDGDWRVRRADWEPAGG